jgi:YggT family protein
MIASTRTTVADYVSTVVYVYIILIFLYVVLQLLFNFGLRLPYSRASDVILTFLRDVCEPFLRIFRRLIPMPAGIDFSPIIAIIVLELLNGFLVQGILRG